MRFSARDAVIAIAITALLCVLLSGGSVRDAAAEIDPGIGQTIVEGVGEPTGWIADRFPFAAAQSDLTSGLSPDDELGEGGFDEVAAGAAAAGSTGSAGHPRGLRSRRGRRARAREAAARDAAGHRRLALHSARPGARPPAGARGRRGDPRPAPRRPGSRTPTWSTGASSRAARSREHEPDAVVVFIGANEGYAMAGPGGEEVECCGPEYAAAYANRVRQVMDTFRQRRSGEGLLADGDDAARRRRAADREARQRLDPGRRPALGRPGAGRRHGPDLHPGRPLPRLDAGRRRGHDRARVRRHPPQRRRRRDRRRRRPRRASTRTSPAELRLLRCSACRSGRPSSSPSCTSPSRCTGEGAVSRFSRAAVALDPAATAVAAAVVLTALVVGLDHLQRLAAAHVPGLDRGHVGGAEVPLLARDVAPGPLARRPAAGLTAEATAAAAIASAAAARRQPAPDSCLHSLPPSRPLNASGRHSSPGGDGPIGSRRRGDHPRRHPRRRRDRGERPDPGRSLAARPGPDRGRRDRARNPRRPRGPRPRRAPTSSSRRSRPSASPSSSSSPAWRSTSSASAAPRPGSGSPAGCSRSGSASRSPWRSGSRARSTRRFSPASP